MDNFLFIRYHLSTGHSHRSLMARMLHSWIRRSENGRARRVSIIPGDWFPLWPFKHETQKWFIEIYKLGGFWRVNAETFDMVWCDFPDAEKSVICNESLFLIRNEIWIGRKEMVTRNRSKMIHSGEDMEIIWLLMRNRKKISYFWL
jgi:hypothetical protein